MGAVPKRSQLAQERSRDTRRAILRAALELWAQRGYENGFERTTAEEIATRAGISKATFYLHFARKEDILLHTGWITAGVVYEDALAEIAAGRELDAAVDRMMNRLGRRVQRVPRAALRRILDAQMSMPRGSAIEGESFGLEQAFLALLQPALEAGQLPERVSITALATMLKAITIDAIWQWSEDGSDQLSVVLRQRAALVIVGARNIPDAVR
ncbi:MULTISPECIES: TetR/AcrR family transcriptional regulator [Frankia]|uniref:TetR/AcrR family transcriptional regulator n=1 Tax=Frankia umida TaxID=573489 RepID=A0ABT0JVF2_9ACTN|nr:MULTISPECIES: TetR/AcrR family transcriptional regulator [Frankia]MCK9875334.1 TetR/AcrR family transcriptional regulator [Frankia umida]